MGALIQYLLHNGIDIRKLPAAVDLCRLGKGRNLHNQLVGGSCQTSGNSLEVSQGSLCRL